MPTVTTELLTSFATLATPPVTPVADQTPISVTLATTVQMSTEDTVSAITASHLTRTETASPATEPAQLAKDSRLNPGDVPVVLLTLGSQPREDAPVTAASMITEQLRWSVFSASQDVPLAQAPTATSA